MLHLYARVILQLLLFGRCTSKIPLYLGGLFPTPRIAMSEYVKQSTYLAVDHVNRDDSILSDYELVLISNTTQGRTGVALDVLYYQLHNPPTKIMMIGSLFSSIVEPTAELTGVWNLIQVTYGGSSPNLSNRNKYPYFFRTIPSMDSFNPARLAFIRDSGWERVATINQLMEPHTTTTTNLLKVLGDSGISVIASESFSTDPAAQIRVIKEKDARIILGNFFEERASRVFCEAYKQGVYGPKYVWFVPGGFHNSWWEKNLDDVDCTADELKMAMAGYFSVVWASLSTDPRPTISQLTAEEYSHEIHDVMNKSCIGDKFLRIMGFAYDAVWACAVTLNNSIHSLPLGKTLETFEYKDEEAADVLKAEMHKTKFLGVSGPLEFKDDGDRKGVILIEQNIGSSQVEIGRYYATTDSLVWGKAFEEIWKETGGHPPSDSDTTIRTVKLQTVSTAAMWCMLTMAVFGVCLALGFLVFNILYRNKRVIKMSSPNINNIMVCGCIITYISVICNGLDRGVLSMDQFAQVCQVRPWILAIGFTLSFGAMFSKTWRVYKVFTSKVPTRKSVRDHQLLTMVGVMVTVDIVILIAWQILSPMAVQDKVMSVEELISGDALIEYINTVQNCYSHNFQEFSITMYAYKGLLLLFGTFLTWQTRSVQLPGLNDSKYVGMSLYNVVIFSTIGLPISILLKDNPNAVYIIVDGFILFCTTATLLLMFVPKIMAVKRGEDGLGNRGQVGILDNTTDTNRSVATTAALSTRSNEGHHSLVEPQM